MKEKDIQVRVEVPLTMDEVMKIVTNKIPPLMREQLNGRLIKAVKEQFNDIDDDNEGG